MLSIAIPCWKYWFSSENFWACSIIELSKFLVELILKIAASSTLQWNKKKVCNFFVPLHNLQRVKILYENYAFKMHYASQNDKSLVSQKYKGDYNTWHFQILT